MQPCLRSPIPQALPTPPPRGRSRGQARGGHESGVGRTHTSKQGALRDKACACRRAAASRPPQPRVQAAAPHILSRSPTQSCHLHCPSAAPTTCATGCRAGRRNQDGPRSHPRDAHPLWPPPRIPLPWMGVHHYRGWAAAARAAAPPVPGFSPKQTTNLTHSLSPLSRLSLSASISVSVSVTVSVSAIVSLSLSLPLSVSVLCLSLSLALTSSARIPLPLPLYLSSRSHFHSQYHSHPLSVSLSLSLSL